MSGRCGWEPTVLGHGVAGPGRSIITTMIQGSRMVQEVHFDLARQPGRTDGLAGGRRAR